MLRSCLILCLNLGQCFALMTRNSVCLWMGGLDCSSRHWSTADHHHMRGQTCLLFNYTHEPEHRLAPTTLVPATCKLSQLIIWKSMNQTVKYVSAGYMLSIMCEKGICTKIEIFRTSHLPPSLLVCGLEILKLDFITLEGHFCFHVLFAHFPFASYFLL